MGNVNLTEQLQYDERESPIYLPNEIFIDIRQQKLNGAHVALAYSYYYLLSWMYRYAKHGYLTLDTKDIKEILGYNRENSKINYILKKDGVLDQMGYTYTSTDYPIAWTLDNGDLEFSMFSELDRDSKAVIYSKRSRNYKIKVPVKGLWRDKEPEDDGYLDGTFHDISNTHHIPFEIFIDCMESDKIGCVGFYLYGFLKNKCQWHDGKYNSSVERIAEDSGLSHNTVDKYLDSLCECGMIGREENECMKYEDGTFKRKPTTYSIMR